MAGYRGFFARIAAGATPHKNPLIDVESIVEHLRYLLNTRVGEAATVPDYGIEDLSDLTHLFPEAADNWKLSIRYTIEKYEQRLTQVRVKQRPTGNPLIIGFELTARLTHDTNQRLLTWQTEVDPSGQFEIR